MRSFPVVPTFLGFTIVLFVLYFMSGCTYQDDFSFISDARAGKFSEEVFVNAHLCTDVTGKVGACTIQVPNSGPITLAISERPYAYRISIVCSDKIGFPTLSASVEEMKRYEIPIPFPAQETSFTCQGEIFPSDRDEAVSTQFEVRVKVYASTHIPLDTPRVQSGRIVVGEYALHTRVCVGKLCQWKERAPYFKSKLKGDYYIRSESASGRVAYYGN